MNWLFAVIAAKSELDAHLIEQAQLESKRLEEAGEEYIPWTQEYDLKKDVQQ